MNTTTTNPVPVRDDECEDCQLRSAQLTLRTTDGGVGYSVRVCIVCADDRNA